ncbi:MAG: hypothetical protein AB7P20_09485 [Rhizobiaceae bacterium]
MIDFEVENFRLLAGEDKRYLALFDVVLACGVKLRSVCLFAPKGSNGIAIVCAPDLRHHPKGRAFHLTDDLHQAISDRVGAAYSTLTGTTLDVRLPHRPDRSATVHRAAGVLYTTDAGIAHYVPDDAAGVRRVLGAVEETMQRAGL